MVGKNEVFLGFQWRCHSEKLAMQGTDVQLRWHKPFLCRSLLSLWAPAISDYSKTQGIPDIWWPFWLHVSLLKLEKPRVHRIRASQTWIQELAPAHRSWVTLGKSLTSLVWGSSSAKWGQRPPPWVVLRIKGDNAQKEHNTRAGT